MPKINIEVPHTIGQELAVSRIKGLLNKLKSDYKDNFTDLNENWTGNSSEFSFKIMGMKVNGSLHITPSIVHVNGDLPLLASPFKKTIEEKIREETEKLLK